MNARAAADDHFSPEFFCDHPTVQTPGTEPGPWDGEALFSGFPTRDPITARYSGESMRCHDCGAVPEPILYQGPHGDFVCGQCAITCPYCSKRPAIVSARRPANDPSAPGAVDHVCLECLEERWQPKETLLGAYLCPGCEGVHFAAEECCRCHGEGWHECDDADGNASAAHCGCPKGEQLSAEQEREWAWMKPHVARAAAARRAGDHETADQIRHDVLRHDSPHDPMNRKAVARG